MQFFFILVNLKEYLETLFRIWTFALRWKRKNYNKIILAFISDYIYWKENQHPFAEILENHLVNFNEYYVENFHSRLHANINVNQNAESIINQALVIGKFNIYIYNTNIKEINLLIVQWTPLDSHK